MNTNLFLNSSSPLSTEKGQTNEFVVELSSGHILQKKFEDLLFKCETYRIQLLEKDEECRMLKEKIDVNNAHYARDNFDKECIIKHLRYNLNSINLSNSFPSKFDDVTRQFQETHSKDIESSLRHEFREKSNELDRCKNQLFISENTSKHNIQYVHNLQLKYDQLSSLREQTTQDITIIRKAFSSMTECLSSILINGYQSDGVSDERNNGTSSTLSRCCTNLSSIRFLLQNASTSDGRALQLDACNFVDRLDKCLSLLGNQTSDLNVLRNDYQKTQSKYHKLKTKVELVLTDFEHIENTSNILLSQIADLNLPGFNREKFLSTKLSVLRQEPLQMEGQIRESISPESKEVSIKKNPFPLSVLLQTVLVDVIHYVRLSQTRLADETAAEDRKLLQVQEAYEDELKRLVTAYKTQLEQLDALNLKSEEAMSKVVEDCELRVTDIKQKADEALVKVIAMVDADKVSAKEEMEKLKALCDNFSTQLLDVTLSLRCVCAHTKQLRSQERELVLQKSLLSSMCGGYSRVRNELASLAAICERKSIIRKKVSPIGNSSDNTRSRQESLEVGVDRPYLPTIRVVGIAVLAALRIGRIFRQSRLPQMTREYSTSAPANGWLTAVPELSRVQTCTELQAFHSLAQAAESVVGTVVLTSQPENNRSHSRQSSLLFLIADACKVSRGTGRSQGATCEERESLTLFWYQSPQALDLFGFLSIATVRRTFAAISRRMKSLETELTEWKRKHAINEDLLAGANKALADLQDRGVRVLRPTEDKGSGEGRLSNDISGDEKRLQSAVTAKESRISSTAPSGSSKRLDDRMPVIDKDLGRWEVVFHNAAKRVYGEDSFGMARDDTLILEGWTNWVKPSQGIERHDKGSTDSSSIRVERHNMKQHNQTQRLTSDTDKPDKQQWSQEGSDDGEDEILREIAKITAAAVASDRRCSSAPRGLTRRSNVSHGESSQDTKRPVLRERQGDGKANKENMLRGASTVGSKAGAVSLKDDLPYGSSANESWRAKSVIRTANTENLPPTKSGRWDRGTSKSVVHDGQRFRREDMRGHNQDSLTSKLCENKTERHPKALHREKTVPTGPKSDSLPAKTTEGKPLLSVLDFQPEDLNANDDENDDENDSCVASSWRPSLFRNTIAKPKTRDLFTEI